MKKQLQFSVAAIIFLGAVSSLQGSSAPAVTAQQAPAVPPGVTDMATSRAAREEKALLDARRQRLVEQEAALSAKEAELKKLSDKLELQLKTLEETKKRYDEAMKAQSEVQKKQQSDKVTRMVKLFKAMRAEQSAKLVDALPEQEAIVLLERLDIKTIAKMVPFLNQPRIVRWIDENLNIRK
jgi:flagellar motility protein MotE (MotC chaperone)